MAVRLRTLAWSIRNFHRRDRPSLQSQVRHIVLENNFGVAGSVLRNQDLSEQTAGASHQNSASHHEYHNMTALTLVISIRQTTAPGATTGPPRPSSQSHSKSCPGTGSPSRQFPPGYKGTR